MADEIAPSTAAPTSSDEQYRPLFALSPQPGWVYDRATLRFLEVNEAAVRSYGWTREEFLAMTIRDIRPPAAQAGLDALLDATSDSHSHNTLSVHRTKAGRVLRVEISSYPLEFVGRAARMVLVHDVTEREYAAEALVMSEEKYRTVIEQLQDVFFRTDTAGHWTFLNQAWTTLTGNSVASSLGTHYLSYVHPSDRASALDAIAPLTSGSAEKAMVEVRYFNASGGYRWVEASTHVVRDDDGRIIGTMGTLRDVTERRAVNEERHRLETNIRQLLDASGEGIYGLDAHGVISFVNRRGSEMLGYTAEELIGKQMHALTHHSRPDGSPYPAAECPIHRAATEGIACEVSDEVMWRKDGRDMQVEYVASPVVEQGRLTGAVVNFRDITARKHAEFELIVARDAAESASRAKSDFLARMSHELRTPLNSIIGFANVLRKNRSSTMSEDQLSFANRIATNGLHLLGLINDILDLSKIEAGRMTLDLSAVMLDTLVRETIDELEGEAKDLPVAVRAEIPDVIRSIGTDAARMKQVLINLIGNSLKFTEQGEVVVTIEADPLGVPQRISVRDTGIGIPKDRLDAIFNVFEQAESVTSRRFGGTGLGLAISRSLCELMGHRLEVESVEGVGTTMLIQLGVAPRAARRSMPGIAAIPDPKPIAQASDAQSPQSPVVLIADEDDDTALLLGQNLEEAGCRVERADSGVDALRMARDLLPDMIFLDLRLPKISGFDVFRILKSDDMLKDTPVVITSVAGSEARPGLAGAAAILDKPISREQAIDLVRLWMPSTAA
jgi:PAS domain S-box-containing protein